MDIAVGILIIFPFGAAIIGALYLRMYFKAKARLSLVTGLLWLMYSLYEHLIYFNIACPEGCNIRVDLLLIYPILFVMSVISTVLYFRKKNMASENE